ncbi:MAG: Hpt domain-containing protein [Synechococcales cyanobacterium T60_A2020_003]|nr:Hpt domain-containing protein [Synechococcales cyanobacterium T60_A2020_003]
MSSSNQDLKIDWDHLHTLSDRDLDFEIELLTLLAQDTRGRVAELRQVMSQNNFAQFQELTHYIKGAAANMGVTSLAAIAQQLESADPGDAPGIHQLIDQLETALQSLEALIAE